MFIVGVIVVVGGVFVYVGGWLMLYWLIVQCLVDELQCNGGGVYLGYCCNYVKGVCVVGYFEGNGKVSVYFIVLVFVIGCILVVGCFVIFGGNLYVLDSSVLICSLVLCFNLLNGQQWCIGMNSMLVFLVVMLQMFYVQQLVSQKDLVIGKFDLVKFVVFFVVYLEMVVFCVWVKIVRLFVSFVIESYYGLDVFYFVDV